MESLHDLSRKGFMYFISSKAQKAIKVGFAKDVYSRMKSLQTGNPDELTLTAYIPCELRAEREFHRQMRHKRTRLEWYPDDEQLFWFMTEVQDDMFDMTMEDLEGDATTFESDLEASKFLSAAYKRQIVPASLIARRLRESLELERTGEYA